MRTFKEQLKVGTKYEHKIDKFIEREWGVIPEQVTMELQWLGIDRILQLENGGRSSIEYKSDLWDNGNMFIETVADDKRSIPGWAYTSIANYLIYYKVKCKKLYLFDMQEFKRGFPDWIKGLEEKEVKNAAGYSAWGVPFSLQKVIDNLSFTSVWNMG